MLISGGSAQTGVVLRIALNKEADDFVQHLTGVLTSSVDQFQAHGQYSTAPHHIKLIELPPTLGRVNFYLGNNSEVQATYARVVEVASRFSTVQGQITAKSTVNPSTGEVSLRVKSTDCLLLGRQLSSAVPGATDWYSRTEDGFSVSVGKFTGLPAHRAGLEAWLNNELSASENIFPSFNSSSVEFSEEWMAIGLPAQIIALSALRPFGSFEPFGAAGAAAAAASTSAPAPAASAVAAAPPAAPTPTAAIAAEPPAPPAAPAEAPVESGPKKVWGSANGAVPQSLREAGLKATPEQPKFAPKATPVTATSAKAGGTAPASAAAAAAAKPAAPASASSKAALGPTAAPSSGPALGSNGATATATTAGGGGAVDGGAAGGVSGAWTCPSCKLENFPRRTACFKCQTDKPEQLGPALYHPRKPLITANKPEGDVRDGDWTCTSCKGHNFASKIACFTCRASRPGVDDAMADAAAGADAAGKARPVSIKPGDWTCPKCKENVFAHRSRCYKCTTAKPNV